MTEKEKAAQKIKEILASDDAERILPLFVFDNSETPEKLVFRFNLWSRYAFPQFFKSKDAPFHKDMDLAMANLYLGNISSLTDLGFRGCAKTTRSKLFVAFVIANDLSRRRKYFKILSHDGKNSKQFVTDVYNLLIDPLIKGLYPDIFQKTETKREETMSSFTTATGIKLLADTVGSAQRGQIQEDVRPDFVLYDDFETRVTLRSAVITKSIWDNMEEAKNGLAKGGASLYLGNYLSERGNVHRLVEKKSDRNVVLIVPIIKNGEPTWPERYTKEDIKGIKNDAEDFEGEYLSSPSASRDIYFDRERLDRMPKLEPIKEIAGFKMFKEYNPSHRYAGGADVAGGVGLDSCASVFIDFDTLPAQVVGTFHSNTIKPDVFGDELASEGRRFGECLIAPENNKFDMCIGRLKQIYPAESIYIKQRNDAKVQNRQSVSAADYGWNTNSLTKSKMMSSLSKAIEDGLIELNDAELIAECRSYTRNDLMDNEIDPRLATRHYDLLIALAIAWQMKDHARYRTDEVLYEQPPYEPASEYETGHGQSTKRSEIHFIDL